MTFPFFIGVTMQEKKFTKVDKEKLIQFLNFGAKHMKLKDPSWDESIEFVQLLTYMQQAFLPKLNVLLESLEKVPEPIKTEVQSEEKPKRGRPKKEQ